jgi:DNA polymerase alpha subunit B
MWPQKVRMLPNPAIFSINEVVFAVTSVDALMPIKAAEYVRDAKRAAEESEMELDDVPRDAISRVCRHVLRQRIIYPTFPAPLPGAGLELVNLDVTHMDLLKLGEGGVDVAILPSSLGKHFVKVGLSSSRLSCTDPKQVVDSSIVVNPSLLTKASAGGTFARFTIYPMDKQELKGELRSAQSDPNLAIEHKVWERSKVEIIRI